MFIFIQATWPASCFVGVHMSFCRTLDGRQTRQKAVTYKEQHKHRSLAEDSNARAYYLSDKRQQTPQAE